MKPDAVFKLVQELKRRRVFRGIVVYGASTLILLEAAQNISNVFGLDAVPRWFLLLLGVGFLLSLWFSWIYDITPGGIRKTEPSSEAKVPIPKKEVRTYQTTTFISIVIIIVLLSYNIIDNAKAKQIKSLDKSIAVLPLYDAELSPTEARNFEFIGHEITSCLTKVKEYRIVPWEDSRKYSRQGKKYSSMGNDLSAAILVDWRPHETEADRRLSVDLIASEDERLLWSENYEIEGDWPVEICRYSRKISKRITRELRTYLTPQERAIISEVPVSARASMYASLGNAMTHDVRYLIQTGNILYDTLKSEYIDSISYDRAIKYFTYAIEEDPTFAEAYANRAKAKLWGFDAEYFKANVLIECIEDIKKAFELEPNLPEAHVAMGFYHYYGRHEYQWALTSFEKAVELRPNENEYLLYLSFIWRTLGNREKVQLLTDRVFASNPRNILFLTNLGISYLYLQDFSKSIECQDRAIELYPQWYAPYINKVKALVSLKKLTEARAVILEAKEKTSKDYFRTIAELDLYEGKYASAVKNIESAKFQEYKDLSETLGDAYLLKAKIYRHAGILVEAVDYYQMAVDFYNNLIKFDPEDYIAYSKLGIAFAGIGADQKARKSGQTALELIETQKELKFVSFILYDLLQLYAMTGDHETAFKLLNDLLHRKSYFTRDLIKLDPDLKSLCEDI